MICVKLLLIDHTEFFTVGAEQVTVFWYMTSRSLVAQYQIFGETPAILKIEI